MASSANIVYIKDGSFLPSIIELSQGDSISFSNEDAVTYELHCRDNPLIPETRIRSKKTASIKFPSHGRYEITEVMDRTMRCLVEVKIVEHENIPKPNTRYFPLSSETVSIRRSQSAKTPPLMGSVKLPVQPVLTKSPELSWPVVKAPWIECSLMESKDKRVEESDDEELDNMKSLRRLYKQGSSPATLQTTADKVQKVADESTNDMETSVTLQTPSPTLPLSATNSLHDKFPAAENESNHKDSENCNDESCGVTYCVNIKDFDFDKVEIDIELGDAVEFKLSSSVPLHAEHIVYGTSDIKELRFESPMLQVDDIRSFVYIPNCEGEVVVSCRIYREMRCVIRVHSHASWIALRDESHAGSVATVDAVVGMSYQLIGDRDVSGCTAHTIDEDSFYDSDDIFTEEEKESWDNTQSEAVSSFSSQYTKQSHPNMNNVLEDGYYGELIDPDMKVHSVYIDEFSFRPLNLLCKVGEGVRFVLDVGTGNNSEKSNFGYTEEIGSTSSDISCCLECDGLFEHVNLSKKNPVFVCKFSHPGLFEVKNEVFQFSSCTISVSLDSPPQRKKQTPPILFGSFLKNDLPSRPIFHLPTEESVRRDETKLPSPPIKNAAVLKAVGATLSDSESENEGELMALEQSKKKSKTAKKRQNKRKRNREAKLLEKLTDDAVVSVESKVPSEAIKPEATTISAVSSHLAIEIPSKQTVPPSLASHSPSIDERKLDSAPSSPIKLAFVEASCDDIAEFSEDSETEVFVDSENRARSIIVAEEISSEQNVEIKEEIVLPPMKVFDEVEDISSTYSDSEGYSSANRKKCEGVVDQASTPVSLPNAKTNILRSFLRINGDSHVQTYPLVAPRCNGLTDLTKILIPDSDSDVSSDVDLGVVTQSFDRDGFVDQDELFYGSFFEQRIISLKDCISNGREDTLPSGRKVPIIFWKALSSPNSKQRKRKNKPCKSLDSTKVVFPLGQQQQQKLKPNKSQKKKLAANE